MFSSVAAQKLSSLMASKPQHLRRIADTTLLAAANAKKPRTMVTSADGSKPSTMKDAFSNYASYLNNLSAREIYLKGLDPQRNSLPDGSNVQRLRDFINHVYVDRRYTGERNLEKPLREKMV